MHELGYTQDILQTVNAAAINAGATEVKAVYLVIGEARDIVDELFVGCFTHFAKGTPAQGAAVQIERVPLTVRCKACGRVYPIDIHDEGSLGCAGCGACDYGLESGMEFRIDRIEVA